MSSEAVPPAVRSLAAAAVKLARSTTSGRVAFAHAHAVVDPAALPERIRRAITDELDAAAATVTPLDAKAAAKALKDAWGQDPHKVVDDLDLDAPLAVTPGAQVHRATLDGDPVIVKLLRPGVSESIRSDLALLETLVGPAGVAFPRLDAGAALREVRERVLDELDLEHEASVLRTASRALRRHAQLSTPSPVTDLCHERVLVAAHVDGPTLADGVPAGEDSAAVARTVLRAAIGLPRTAGLVHADMSPANVILTGSGTITLVDFGASARVDAARMDLALGALQALRDDDAPAFGDAVLGLGVLPDADSAAQALALLRTVGGELLTGRARLDADALIALSGRIDAHARDGFALALKVTLDPQDLWALRMLGTLVATLARLGATEDWIALTLEAGRDGC